MPTSTDIKLPKSQPPAFPERCVACGLPAPGTTYRARVGAGEFWTAAFWGFGRAFAVDVPACESCIGRMRRQRYLRAAAFVAATAVGIVAGIYVGDALFREFRKPWRRWLVKLTAVAVWFACCLPVFLFEVFSPRPLSLSESADAIEYEFRDAEYAREFAALNGVSLGDA